jgi:hypothetical protein
MPSFLPAHSSPKSSLQQVPRCDVVIVPGGVVDDVTADPEALA